MAELPEYPSTEFLRIVRELERLGGKIDSFIDKQISLRQDFDLMKFDISGLKSDITELKILRRETKSYLTGVIATAGIVSSLVSLLAGPILKKFFGI